MVVMREGVGGGVQSCEIHSCHINSHKKMRLEGSFFYIPGVFKANIHRFYLYAFKLYMQANS